MKVKDEIHVHSLKDGKFLKRVASDFVGTISVSGYRDQPWFFSTLTSFTTPGTIGQYRFDEKFKDEEKWLVYRTTQVKGLNSDDFISEQVWYDSADGTKIPMFIVRHKSTPLDGTAPAIQYGMGLFVLQVPELIFVFARLWRFLDLHKPLLQSCYAYVPTKLPWHLGSS